MVPVTEPGNAKNTATLRTSEGDITITLFPDHAPKTVANFVGLATGDGNYSQPNASGGDTGPFYDGSVFHRVISGFMLQGGDPTGTGRGGPGYQFGDEFHPELQVADADSRAVVDKIASTSTDRSDRPLTDIVIQKIEIS